MLDFLTLEKNKRLYKDEKILCVAAFDEKLDKEFIEFKGKDHNLLTDTKGKYMYRYKVEGDIGMYQLIPYLVVINEKGEILSHISKKDNRISLGFSTHITEDIGGHYKIATKTCMHLAMYNLGEFAIGLPIKLAGYIKTHTETTKGHLGMLYILQIKDTKIKEDDNFIYEFKTKKDLFDNHFGKLEEWAKIVLSIY